MDLNQDIYWMSQALNLARKGFGNTSPNPCVGAVIVKNGHVIGQGYHQKFGSHHAEVLAIKSAKTSLRGAKLYVTLEPCSTQGKTPACTEAIIQSGIRHVIIGAKDPNPKHRGKTQSILSRHQIKCTYGVLKEQSEQLVQPFKTWIQKKRPYVTVKVAQSLDGKIATRTGKSKWISSSASRQWVQHLRSRMDAILVGIGTANLDNPRLNIRTRSRKALTKIVVDSRLRISPRSRLFKTPGEVIIATTKKSSLKKRQQLSRMAEVLVLPSVRDQVSLPVLLKKLAQKGIMHLLVEGGGTVIASLIEKKLVDEFYTLICPVIIGGKDAPTAVEGLGILDLSQKISLKDVSVSTIEQETLIHGRL